MAEQQEMNVFKMYEDGVNHFSEFWQKNGWYGPFSMSDGFHSVSKNACSGMEMYKEWISVLGQLTDDSLMLYQKALKGEKPDTENFLNSSAQKCENLTDRMMQIIKDTPFKGMEPVLKTVKDSVNVKNNGHLLKAVMVPGIETGVFMLSTLRSSCSNALDMMTSAMKRNVAASNQTSV